MVGTSTAADLCSLSNGRLIAECGRACEALPLPRSPRPDFSTSLAGRASRSSARRCKSVHAEHWAACVACPRGERSRPSACLQAYSLSPPPDESLSTVAMAHVAPAPGAVLLPDTLMGQF